MNSNHTTNQQQLVMLQHPQQQQVGQNSSSSSSSKSTVISSQPSPRSTLSSGPPDNEVFVGNLSYFCEEDHLFVLFSEYFYNVANVRIMRNHDRTRSLMYGFVATTSPLEAVEMIRLLNGHLFMGRNIRVESSDRQSQRSSPRQQDGFQVHVAISSSFTSSQIIKPTEVLLRKYFIRYGHILDVQVNYYNIHPISNRQEGYAFLNFESESSATTVIRASAHFVDGIQLLCTTPQRQQNHQQQAQPQAQSTMHINNPTQLVSPKQQAIGSLPQVHQYMFTQQQQFHSAPPPPQPVPASTHSINRVAAYQAQQQHQQQLKQIQLQQMQQQQLAQYRMENLTFSSHPASLSPPPASYSSGMSAHRHPSNSMSTSMERLTLASNSNSGSHSQYNSFSLSSSASANNSIGTSSSVSGHNVEHSLSTDLHQGWPSERDMISSLSDILDFPDRPNLTNNNSLTSSSGVPEHFTAASYEQLFNGSDNHTTAPF